ncbi:unnamed protein product [Mucor fragilis]
MIKSTERDINTFVDEKAASVYTNKGGSSGKSSDDIPFQKSEAEKKLVKKLNWTLLPFVGAIVFIQFVDKSTLGISAVLGIIEDTHLTGSQYSWLGSFFYLGYISFQLPNNYLIQKFPISKYLGTLLILWGIVMALTALCHNFAQLVVCRVFLGLFEAGTYPCLLIIINAVYRRSEQSAAYGFLWLSNGTGTMIGAACAYGISYIDNARGIHSWKWPYIIWGALTVLFGIICFFFLPDTPQSFMFRLTEEEKPIVAERSRDNCVVRVQKIKMYHVWEALREVRLWLICLACFFNNLLTGGVVVFNTLIVKSMGYSSQESILFQICSGCVSAIFSLVAIFVARRTGQLYLAVVVCTSVSLIGVILLAALPPSGVKLLGYLLAWAMAGSHSTLLTIIAANVNGYTKKIFYNAMYMIAFTLGNFVGPLVMLESEAPNYKTGMIIYSIANAGVLVSLFINRQIMARQNKTRIANPSNDVIDVNDDLTDRENTTFIYKL